MHARSTLTRLRQCWRLAMVATVCGSSALVLEGKANAQPYPVKPIRMILATTPGGSPDILARIVCQKLGAEFQQQFIIDNRPGAGGTIGSEIAARAAADGYTLVVANLGTFAVNPSLYPKLQYDPPRDFQGISQIARVPNMLVVHPAVAATSVKQLIALVRAAPGTINYGSAGNGTAAHLMVEYFKLLTKTDIQHVPYRGTGPALVDLLAGQITMTITGVPPLLPHVRAGKLRALGVTAVERLPQLPELPTLHEAGVPGYEVTQWYGFAGPAGIPRVIVQTLHAAVDKILRLPDVRDRFASEGAEPRSSTPEQFQALIRSEIARWRPVVKASGARPE